MNRWSLAVVAALVMVLLSCVETPAPSPPHAPPAPSGSHGGPCGNDFGKSPFQNKDATHLLVADFFPHREKDPKHIEFADDVTVQVDQELKRFQEEELQNPKAFDIEVPTGALEVGRLRCFLDSHERSKAAAKALGADVVIWGRAYCEAPGQGGATTGPIEVNVRVGEIHTGDQSPVSVGNVMVPEAKPFAVCP